MNTPDWDELFSAAGRAPRDDDAWSALYVALWPYLADSIATRYRLDADRTGALLQDAFLQYREKLVDGRIERPSLPHFRAFVRYCALTALSDARRFVAIDQIAPAPVPGDPEAEIVYRLIVDQALDQLDGRCAYVLRARYFFGETSAEIGQALGLQPGNVDVLLHRCRARFREKFDDLATRLQGGAG